MNRRLTLGALLAAALGLIGPGPAGATDRMPADTADSLMFTAVEVARLEQAIAAGPLYRLNEASGPEAARSRLRQSLYLSGIVYNGPDNWSIWINNQRIAPGTGTTHYQVVSVSETQVTLLVPWGEGSVRQVELSVNQRFQPQRGSITGGAQP